MGLNLRSGLLLLFGLIGLCTLGPAQNFKYNTQPKGVKLPSQNIFQTEQDTLGRMWFSTSRGTFYSDGIQTFPLPDSIYGELNHRISVHKDADGWIWLYHATGKPKLWRGGYGDWQEIDFEVEFDGRSSTSINFFTLGSGADKHYFLDTKAQLLTWKEGDNTKTLVSRDNISMGILASGELFGDIPYLYFEHATVQWKNKEFIPVEITGTRLPSAPYAVKYCQVTDSYYFLGKSYLAKGPSQDSVEVILDKDISKSDYFLEDYFGLYFSGGSIFYHFNSHLRKLELGENGALPLVMDLEPILYTFFIQSSFADREGILWISTNRGLANVNNLAFQNYSINQWELLGEEISALAVIEDNRFLFGFNNGIQQSSGSKIATVFRDDHPAGVPTERIINFTKQTENGDIWYSANWGGVGKYSTALGRVEKYPAPEGVNISYITLAGDSLLITGPNDLYLSSKYSKGSALYSNNLKEGINELVEQSFFFLRKAAKLNDGRIIVMRASRLENQNPVFQNDRFVITEGYDFLELDSGRLLLGTESGLKIFENDSVKHYAIEGLVIDNPVYCILKDSHGKIWLGTDDGIYAIENNKISHFNENNGLVGNEVNRGALLETSRRQIMIGTTKGLSVFLPDQNRQHRVSPKVHLNAVVLGDAEINSSENLSTSYSRNTLEVNYSAVGFNETKELWVHYRMKYNGSEDWQLIKDPNNTTLFFTNLPAGTYQFELKASYAGEDFSPVLSTPPFLVKSPFYLQGWFISLTILLLVGLGILINMLYRQLRKVGLLKSAFDDTDREKKIAEQQFKNVWDSSKDGLILTLDAEYTVAANPAFGHIVQMDPDKLEGRPVADYFEDTVFYSRQSQRLLSNVLKTPGVGFTYETIIPWKSGMLEMEVFSILIQTGYQGKNLILSVLRDISSKKSLEFRLKDAKEKAEQASRFKSSLISNFSHEIRTPLNGILGGTEHIMMTRKDDAELLSHLDIILQSGERLLNTVNSILDKAKIEANKMEVVYSETDINDFIATVSEPLKNLAAKKGIGFKTIFLHNPLVGNIDRRFLEMIINNLVSNSIKYTEKGEILLSVDRIGNRLFLKIEDTGVGMTEDFLEKIFRPFEQESTGHNRLYDGTGLGMSITKSLVELLHGTINVESVKNEGTMVTLEIPLTDP